MGYVFNEIFWWLLGALVVGFMLGWLFWKCRSWPAAAERRAQEPAESTAFADTRGLEVAALTVELDERAGALASMSGRLVSSDAEILALRTRVAELELTNAEVPTLRAPIAEPEVGAAVPAAVGRFAADTGIPAGGSDTDPELDIGTAALILGRRIRRDDLTVVEGIGPKIAELIVADGIDTWRKLSRTEPRHIKGLLDAAGRRFRMHHPDTWPEQAALLADGRWEEFEALSEALDGGVRMAPGAVRFVASEEDPVIDLDFESAVAVLGFLPARDDLKVVEGIGPAIETLLDEAGIDTWRKLSTSDPADLTLVLQAAGPRFRIHDPATWPRQAGLLAAGRWEEFSQLTDQLKGGRG